MGKINTKIIAARVYVLLLVMLGGGITAGVSSAQTDNREDLTADQVAASELKPEALNSFGRGRREDPTDAKQRGMIPTGLKPLFAEGIKCRGIDDYWAMDYSHKRGRETYHGGIDIPAPRGTPVLAVADGVVVGKFLNKDNPKGIEIMLWHSPQDTGHEMWVYTQYTHLLEIPDLEIGQRVRMGEVIGKTSNSGISGREARKRHGAGGGSG